LNAWIDKRPLSDCSRLPGVPLKRLGLFLGCVHFDTDEATCDRYRLVPRNLMPGTEGRDQVISRRGSAATGSDRPLNDLLRCINDRDFALLAPHLEEVSLAEGSVIYNPGDQVETVHFPCGASLIAFVVAIDDGHEVDAVQTGRDGAAGGIINDGHLPAFTRIVVRFGGSFVRLPISKLNDAKRKSPSLLNIFSRYADCLFAETLQSIACNATHSIEERAAKWIATIMERTGSDLVPLTHDQLASMLGVGRSYTSRVIQSFREAGILETKRGLFLVRDRGALLAKSCLCKVTVGQHFVELLGSHYGARRNELDKK
jgi:Crp-like helix-turn-helix domain